MSPKVFFEGFSDPVRAFIDTGSDATFVELSLCLEICLSLGPAISRTVVPVGGVRTTIQTREVILPLQSKTRQIVNLPALAVPDLHKFFTGAPTPPDKFPILLVFGQDYFSDLEIERTGQISPEGFQIMSSRFGDFAVNQNFLRTPEIPMRRLRLNGLQEIVPIPSPVVPSPVVSHPIVSHSVVSHPIVSSSIVSSPIECDINSKIPSVKDSSIPPDKISLNFTNPSLNCDPSVVPPVRIGRLKFSCPKEFLMSSCEKIVDRGQVLPLVNKESSVLSRPPFPDFHSLEKSHSLDCTPSEFLHTSPFSVGCQLLLDEVPMEYRIRCKLKLMDTELSHGQHFEDDYPDSFKTCSCPGVPNPCPPAIEQRYRCLPMVKERRRSRHVGDSQFALNGFFI